jgi:hypothetical protein
MKQRYAYFALFTLAMLATSYALPSDKTIASFSKVKTFVDKKIKAYSASNTNLNDVNDLADVLDTNASPAQGFSAQEINVLERAANNLKAKVRLIRDRIASDDEEDQEDIQNFIQNVDPSLRNFLKTAVKNEQKALRKNR